MTDKDYGVGRTYEGSAPFGDHSGTIPIDQVAAGSDTPDGALAIAGVVFDVLQEETCILQTEPQAAAPTALLAGTAVMFRMLAVDGTEYELFIRERA